MSHEDRATDETHLATTAMFELDDAEPGVLPIYQSAIFGRGERAGGYGRRSNPNRAALERALARLEEAEEAVCFPSGMAAIYAVLVASAAQHVILPLNVYGGIYELVSRWPVPGGPTFSFVHSYSPAALERELADNPRALVWMESLSNPLMDVHDIREVATLAHHHGSLVAVDNTLATPLRLKPLGRGADVVVHSATKYLAGHGDVIGGVALTSDSTVLAGLRFFQQTAGVIPSPHDCWLIARGLRTLALRLDRQEMNASAIAAAAGGHDAVVETFYPASSRAARHLIDQGSLRGFGSVVSLTVGSDERALTLMRNLRMFHVAASLGGVESTVSHPATMSHRYLVTDGVATLPPGLIRLSLGIESGLELKRDLLDALDRLP